MSAQSFEIKDFSKPVYLHFNNEKFWETKIIQKPGATICETMTRCGKLLFGKEDPVSVTSVSKAHNDITIAIDYVESHTRLKLGKGYTLISKDSSDDSATISQKTKSYSINVLPPRDDSSLNIEPKYSKRKADSELNRDDLKKKVGNLLADDDKDSDAMSTYSYFPPGDEDSNSQHSKTSQRPKLDDAFFDDDPFVGSNKDQTNRSAPAAISKDKEERKSDEPLPNTEKAILGDPKFRGTYLINPNPKGTMTCTIQVLGKYVKVDIGALNTDRFDNKSLIQFRDEKEALEKAKEKARERLAKGYQFKHELFVFDLKEKDLTEDRSFLHDMPKSPRNSNTSNASNTSNTRTRGRSPANTGSLNIPDKDDDDKYSVTSRRSNLSDDNEDDSDIRNASSSPSSPLGPRNKDQTLGKPITNLYSSVMLAHNYDDKATDPAGWLMSEKLDGVRAIWTGSAMYSRNGKQFFPPKWFTNDLPNSPLDGELFTGRSTFQKCVSYVRKQKPIDSEWKNVTYMVFDCPELKGPFNKRYEKFKSYFDNLKSPWVKAHKHELCKDLDHLKSELKRVEQLGGEGMMIREPTSAYEQRRSNALLKVKTFHDDEATVIDHEEGTGRCSGMLGALRVRNRAGVEFSIGTGFTDAQRKKPPKIGSVVTYKYQNLSDSGVPRFPVYLRIYPGNI